MLRGNITGENNSFNEKQCYSLEDYIEASLVIFQTDQLSIIRETITGRSMKEV